MKEYIDESAKIVNSEYGTMRAFRNTLIKDSVLGENVSIGDDTTIERCRIGNNVAINRRSYINDSTIMDFSYTGINTIINWAKIGKFCSIARNVDIGGFDHDYTKFTTMTAGRLSQMLGDGTYRSKETGEKLCVIGNDVWIAAGVHILNGVNIGNGAVIGAGAIVTKDVPPYAVVVGVPARVVKFRCDERLIDKLEKLQWWDMPEEKLSENMDFIIGSEISEENIDKLSQLL